MMAPKKIRNRFWMRKPWCGWFCLWWLWVWLWILGVPLLPSAWALSPELKAQLTHQIRILVASRTAWSAEALEVEKIRVTPDHPLPQGVRIPIRPLPRAPWTGKTTFALDLVRKGKVVETRWISADVAVWVPVVLTRRPLSRGVVIQPEMVYQGRRRLQALPRGYVDRPEAVIGLRLRRPVGADRPLTRQDLELPPLIRRGDRVWIVAESPTLRVTVVGQAQEEGAEGDWIRVLNLQSRRVVTGRVVAPNRVEVLF